MRSHDMGHAAISCPACGKNKIKFESESAEQTGYNNPYHFIRQFKQIVGMTPGKIRK